MAIIRGDNTDQTLTGTDRADIIYGRGGNDRLKGGGGDDELFGDAGQDTLKGGGGADYLSGDPGDDVLDGGAGNDTLAGLEGDDTLTGGEGADLFLFSALDRFAEGRDTITDFQIGRDLVHLLVDGADLPTIEIARVGEDDIATFSTTSGSLTFAGLGGQVTIDDFVVEIL